MRSKIRSINESSQFRWNGQRIGGDVELRYPGTQTIRTIFVSAMVSLVVWAAIGMLVILLRK